MSEQINELATALNKAQTKIDNASKSTQGHGYRYADLSEILDIISPVFSELGLSHSQIPVLEDGKACLETIIMHNSGQWISGTAFMAHAKLARGNDAQMMGATIAYQRRYSLKAMVGIAEVDEEKNFKANDGKKETQIKDVKQDAIEKINASKNMDDLRAVWKSISKPIAETEEVKKAKDDKKEALSNG